MPAKIFLPSLPHWEFGNFWSGSRGKLRFYITVSKGDEGPGELLVELWDKDVCRELAEITETKAFPCTSQGLDELRDFLEQYPEP